MSEKPKTLKQDNPFYDVYAGELVEREDYVQLFSPKLLEHNHQIVSPINLIIKGAQGSGKSMLLKLLRSESRVAYAENNNPEILYPIPEGSRNFVSGGINLLRFGGIDLGHRQEKIHGYGFDVPPIFADFVNFAITAGLLKSMETLNTGAGGIIANEIGMVFSEKRVNEFVSILSTKETWKQVISGVWKFEKLKETIFDRIVQYNRFINGNIPDLPPKILNTITPIGKPISELVEALREAKVVPGQGEEKVNFIVQIDQYEELKHIDSEEVKLGKEFRQIINKAIALRDSKVFYRIGTRPYAWEAEHTIYQGKGKKLEEQRDYLVLNLEDFFRRKEDRSSWVFPAFAEDVFSKRLEWAKIISLGQAVSLSGAFGKGIPPEEKALNYSKNSKAKVLKLKKDWPEDWKNFLKEVAKESPLSARFGEAWARQRDKGDIVNKIPKNKKEAPWESKPYWKKERYDLALMQIASRCQQAMIFSGEKDALGLSGGNISVFISICREVWDTANRANRNPFSFPKSDGIFDKSDQTIGINKASEKAFRKLSEGTGKGDKRQIFVRILGEHFLRELSSDKALSYPGHNGFSLTEEELEKWPEAYGLLKELSDFGALFDFEHTTKETNKKRRRKWYLNPIFYPYFRLPYKRIKEPEYIKLDKLGSWLERARLVLEIPTDLDFIKTTKSLKNPGGQMPLDFGHEEE